MHVFFQSTLHAETAMLNEDAGLPFEDYSQCGTDTEPIEDEKSIENGLYLILSQYLKHLKRGR